jgi:hypothetical protein
MPTEGTEMVTRGGVNRRLKFLLKLLTVVPRITSKNQIHETKIAKPTNDKNT